MPAGQKRAPDPITDEPPCGCWELNSGPLEEQAMLLTSEPSLQTLLNIFLTHCKPFRGIFFFDSLFTVSLSFFLTT